MRTAPGRDYVQAVIDFVVSRGGEFVELFFESSLDHTIICEDGKIERISSGRDTGFGLRVMTGGRTAYGYSNVIEEEELFKVGREVIKELETDRGRTAALGETQRGVTAGIEIPADGVSIDTKVRMVHDADRAARAAGRGISQVLVSYTDGVQSVSMFNNEGDSITDERRQVVFVVKAVASDGSGLQTAYRNLGGRKGFELFNDNEPEKLAVEAGESAVRTLRARRAPAGNMAVVLSSRAGGTMIHEAIGHGLEGDTAEKGLSIYSGQRGEMIASPLITVVDDATIDGKRGSYVFDDEGVPAQRTVLVERGVLKGYLLNRYTAKKMGGSSTGNGRRQSFRYRPIVRMSNILIVPGEHDPGEIVSSVDQGLYVVRMGGGQVDTSSGDFVFKVNEAYLIEGKKITEPVRGATLIGNGPAVLRKIDMVGSDLGFDMGTCRKDGQQVPVADAQPTLRIPSITVGGEV